MAQLRQHLAERNHRFPSSVARDIRKTRKRLTTAAAISAVRAELIGDLAWRRDGVDWILLHRRRRMGRVLPDDQHRGMYRSVLSRGRLSDMANLSWAKSAVLAVAIRELAWEADHPANDPPKSSEKRGVFYGSAPPVRFSADGGLR
jgi:hypothetical protein